MKLLSTYTSDDQLRTAWVFKKDTEYMVELLDSISHREKKFTFDNEQEAENFAEDWVQ
jgi:hypothetical protein